MGFVFVALFAGLIFGAVGVAIASNKNVDGFVGFLLGAFLGPLGLIIIALLNPSAAASTESAMPVVAASPPCERDLTLDGYKLWLAAKYDIKKNDIFDRFVLRDQTYGELGDALAAAHAIEEEHLAKLAEQEEERRVRRERAAALQAEEAAKAAAFWAKIKLPVISFFAILIVGVAYEIYALELVHSKLNKEMDAKKYTFDASLSEFGIKSYPGTVFTVKDGVHPRLSYPPQIDFLPFQSGPENPSIVNIESDKNYKENNSYKFMSESEIRGLSSDCSYFIPTPKHGRKMLQTSGRLFQFLVYKNPNDADAGTNLSLDDASVDAGASNDSAFEADAAGRFFRDQLMKNGFKREVGKGVASSTEDALFDTAHSKYVTIKIQSDVGANAGLTKYRLCFGKMVASLGH